MKKSKIINVDGHDCKLRLVNGIIQEHDFVISREYFEKMDKNGIYYPKIYKLVEVPIEKVTLIKIGTSNNPEIVLGVRNGAICHKALQQMYSIINITQL